MANSVDPVWSGYTLFASILNLSVMLGNYLQQMTFQMHFFLCALRVKNADCLGRLSSVLGIDSISSVIKACDHKNVWLQNI